MKSDDAGLYAILIFVVCMILYGCLKEVLEFAALWHAAVH